MSIHPRRVATREFDPLNNSLNIVFIRITSVHASLRDATHASAAVRGFEKPG